MITPNSDSLLREKEQNDKKSHLFNVEPTFLQQKVFSPPVKDGGLSALLPEDRVNEPERSIPICEPLKNHNATES